MYVEFRVFLNAVWDGRPFNGAEEGRLKGVRWALAAAAMSAFGAVCQLPARAAPAPAADEMFAAAESLEVRFWNDIKVHGSARDFEIYLEAFPNGKFADEARERLRRLQSGAAAPSPGKPVETAPAPAPAQAPTAPPPTPAPAMSKAADRDCPQCPEMAMIPAGAFEMGSKEMFAFEAPAHHVVIPSSFYMAKREISLAEWDACVADKGCAYAPTQTAPDRVTMPVINLSWDDAQQYVRWLSGKTGRNYRLPSEAEWEYAARGGTTTTYPWGARMEGNRVNCSGCNGGPSNGPVASGSYPPNAFGLYDMLGNAAEWVEDCWHDSYRSAPSDGSAWLAPGCQERVLRGGAFNSEPRFVRSASRYKYDFDVRYEANGFRVVRQ